MKKAVSIVAAVAGSFAILLVAAAASGHSPQTFIAAMVRGSLGSPFALSETLLKAVPLLFTSLAVVVAFRAGVWNIGAEGQFIAGGIAALIAGRISPAPIATAAALLAAMIAGALWSGIAAVLRRSRNVPEVLTTILLNFVAIYLLGWLVNGPLQESSRQYPQSDAVPQAAELRTLGASRLHSGFLIALAAALLVWIILHRTAAGLRLRAIGFNSSAARWAGVRVDRVAAQAMLLSGALAGLGGAVELLGVTHRLYERFAAGYGYSAIAVALLALLDPLGAIAASLFFAVLATGAGELQRSENVSSAVAVLLQALVILVLLAITSDRLTIRLRRWRQTSGEEVRT